MNRRITLGVAVIAAVGLLAGCASSSDESADSSNSSAAGGTSAPEETFGSDAPSGSAEPSESDSSEAPAESSEADASASPAPDEAPFSADASVDSAQAGADAQLVLVDVRSGTHDGYDRLVLEFSGPGTPGWTAQYADSASRQGSGEPITVNGSALLDITVTGSAIPKEGEATVPAGPVAAAGTTISDIFVDGTFEGVTHVVLGTSGTQPFRVFALADPARVVIDVQH